MSTGSTCASGRDALPLTACLNGSRRPDQHPDLPCTPDELARAARAAVDAGATDVHVHPRDAEARESLAASDVDRCVAAVRAAVPGVTVGVTTASSAGVVGAEREAMVRAWQVLPDLASVNWHEHGADSLARCLLDRGVDVEAGVWQQAAARHLVASGLAGACRRVLVEPMEQVLAEAQGNAEAMLALVVPTGRPVLLHGVDGTAWPLLARAASLGLHLRIGLEDVLTDPSGAPVPDGATLVTTARRVAREATLGP